MTLGRGATGPGEVRAPRGRAGGGGTTGYSGTPLVQKLGIKSGARIHLVNAPDAYRALVGALPRGATVVSGLSPDIDIVHVFSVQRAELGRVLRDCRRTLKPEAMIWVSWPKRAARVPTDVTEDVVRELALPLGLVDVKVCAVSAVWSGLKLVLRKELR